MKRESDKFTAIVLAAGKSERMNSAHPKVLHDLMGRPLIYYVLRELLNLKGYVKQIVVVTGYKADQVKIEVKKNFSASHKIEFVHQPKLNGTAKAVAIAFKKAKEENILILCADTPLITAATLGKFISFYLEKDFSGTVLTAVVDKDNSLGLVSYDEEGKLKKITERVEFENKNISAYAGEANSGIYCFKRKSLSENLPKIALNKKKKEYFFTDIIEILYQQKAPLAAYVLADAQQISGINTPKDLFRARKIMQERIIQRLVAKGVKVMDWETTFIDEGVKVGRNTVIYPFTFIEKSVIIGSNCALGPFVHLRKGTTVADNSEIGNFAEINRSKIGRQVKMKHFGYLGDAVVEDQVNIGAGTVTANFDGRRKWKTRLKKGSFIGSDTILVAPLEVGSGSTTGAGSVVTRNVAPKTTVVGVPAKKLKKKR